MKPIYIIAAACLVAFASAQIGPVGPIAGVAAPIIPPVFPPMLGGMLPFPMLPFLGPFGPFGPLGLLGLGGLGGLGLGLGGLGGIGLGGRLGLGGRFGLRGIGKRDIGKAAPLVNEIRCVVSTTNNTIQCSLGVEKTIGCQMVARLAEIPKIKVNLVDLSVIEHVQGSVEFLNLISTKSNSKLAQALTKNNMQSGTFTFIHPSTLEPTLLSIYGDATLGVPGFLVNDQLCYNSLVSVIKANVGKVRTSLIIA